MEILIAVVLIWLASPFVLLFLWLAARGKAKRQQQYLEELYSQHRILPEELAQLGIPVPQQMPPAFDVPADPAAAQNPQIPQGGLLPPQVGVPVQQSSAGSLADAAARAAKIAEAELSGETVTPEILAAEIAAGHVNAPQPEQIAVPESAAAPADEILPAAPESELPASPQTEHAVESVSLSAAEQSAPEHAEQPEQPEQHSAEAPEFVTPAAALQPVRISASLPENPQHEMRPAAAEQSGGRLSAITTMLSVGVLLVIVAGLIFVRSAWSSLTDGGRLATLAAGSVLFFGTSALARRVWKLDRTGMAFFTLGAAFLPISVWAAGYLNLLGDGLSGADNPWLIALAFASFTVIALIAVRVYRMKGWGAAFLCGVTVTYVCLAEAMTLHQDMTAAPFMIAVAVYALILIFGARMIAPKLPAEIGDMLEPFAWVVSVLAAAGIWCFSLYGAGSVLSLSGNYGWSYAIPAFLAAFLFFAPVITERLNQWTALPVSLLTVPAFVMLLLPLYNSDKAAGSFVALSLLITALLWLILLQTNSLPDETRGGFLTAAALMTVLSIPAQLFSLTAVSLTVNLVMLAAGAVMLAVWMFVTRKQNSFPLHVLIGAQVWMLCMSAAHIAADRCRSDDYDILNSGYLLAALCFLAGFILLAVMKKYRTFVSDLALTVSAVFPLLALVYDIQTENTPVYQWCGLALLGGIVLLYILLALAHDTCKPQQYAFASLVPILLSMIFLLAGEGVLSFADGTWLESCWMLCSLAIGAAVYLTTKKRFNGVRKELFALTMVPPVAYAALIDTFAKTRWNVVPLAIAAAAAFGLWKLFANRGFRKLSTASFGTGLFLLLDMTVLLVRDGIYNGNMNYTVLMLAAVWIVLFGLLAVCIRRRMVLLVGGNSVTDVMQAAAPAAALILSLVLLMLKPADWESFYFVFALGMGVLAWVSTKKSQIILPAVSAFSVLFAVEALRDHAFGPTNGAVVIWILVFCGLTLLVPYLGTVLREPETDPKMMRRSYVLTAFGALMPAWLFAAAYAGTYSGEYTHEQRRWMLFFVPVLISAYLLHFLLFERDAVRRRNLITAAAAFGVIAFWMQPLVDVSDTWLEGRLHILPLIAFGLVIRKLYEPPVGGYFLFGVGVYTMVRFAVTAMISEGTADLLTVLITALVMFIASFYIKQGKWFVLGGVSLVLTTMYMHMVYTEGKQWWVYLLLAGLVLILVAGSNEMLKQRGDSLKSRAGRFWEDWTW